MIASRGDNGKSLGSARLGETSSGRNSMSVREAFLKSGRVAERTNPRLANCQGEPGAPRRSLRAHKDGATQLNGNPRWLGTHVRSDDHARHNQRAFVVVSVGGITEGHDVIRRSHDDNSEKAPCFVCRGLGFVLSCDVPPPKPTAGMSLAAACAGHLAVGLSLFLCCSIC